MVRRTHHEREKRAHHERERRIHHERWKRIHHEREMRACIPSGSGYAKLPSVENNYRHDRRINRRVS